MKEKSGVCYEAEKNLYVFVVRMQKKVANNVTVGKLAKNYLFNRF